MYACICFNNTEETMVLNTTPLVYIGNSLNINTMDA